MRIWNRIAGEPWAITETALHTILEIAARENESPQAVAAIAASGRPRRA